MRTNYILINKHLPRYRSAMAVFFFIFCFYQTFAHPLSGSFVYKSITLSDKQQQITIRGNVTTSDGMGLPGLTIMVKGTKNSTATDLDGNFTIAVSGSDSVLVFSYMGYKTQEIKVGSQTVINIIMEDEAQSLNDVIVIGYGTQRKSDVTGAVVSVKPADIVKIGGSNVTEGLQGKVQGVEVMNQGGPGASPQIRIRGLGTNGDSSPLYVVDGMFVNDISYLASRDIASMEILKDASATAIYGSRGANGVILITTKKGKSGETIFNFSVSNGFQFLSNIYDAANGSEYASLVNRAKTNAGQPAMYTDAQIAGFGKGTDWIKESTQNGQVQDYQLSVSGGSDKGNYNVSAGWFKQDGVIKFTSYDRFSLRLNNENKLTKRLTIGENISYVKSNTYGDAFWNAGRGLNSMSRVSPLLTIRQEDGTFTPGQDPDIVNPYAAFYYSKDKVTANNRIVGNAYLNYDIIEGLNFRTSFGIDYLNSNARNFEPAYSVTTPNQTHPSATVQETRTSNYTWLWENTLSYDKQLGEDHHINLLTGITAQENKYNGIDLTGTGMVSENENLRYIQSFPTASLSFLGSLYESSILSYLGRVNYSYKDRYLLTASMRADGSSKFSKGDQWGYFPSVALGWRVSEEAFLKGSKVISNLKLRGSWGQIGSDKISNYLMYSTLVRASEYDAVFNGTFYPNASLNTLASPNITWEFSEQKDLGLELGLLGNRISIELDYYVRDTKNLLLTLPIPGGSVGFTPSVSNSGSVRNRGFEFKAGYNDNFGDVKFGVTTTGSVNKNTVLDFKGQKIISSEFMTNATHVTQEGQSIGNFYGYKVQGIFQNQEEINEYNANAALLSGVAGKQYWNNAKPGDFIYQDTDGNGFVDAKDQKDIGSPHAKFVGGVSLTAAYKGFDVSLDFVGSFGAKIWNVARNQMVSSGVSNLNTEWLNSWTPENTNTNMPRLATDANYINVPSSFNVMNADYIKARNIEVGYSFNEDLLKRIMLSNFRIYINATNPFYITKYNGFSPEVSNYWSVMDQGNDFRTYPVAGTFRLGINLTF